MDPEQFWDTKLHIDTAGRDDSAEDAHHFPYEPTPYSVLERLADSGWVGKDDVLLDYGCGKGRVSLFLNHACGCRSVGIDFQPDLLRQARQNLDRAAAGSTVSFLLENAEEYEVPECVDRIFFFNPFSERILVSAINRIQTSWYAAPRRILLMFYYPSDDYVSLLMSIDELLFYDELDCSDLFPGDNRERILSFELGE